MRTPIIIGPVLRRNQSIKALVLIIDDRASGQRGLHMQIQKQLRV